MGEAGGDTGMKRKKKRGPKEGKNHIHHIIHDSLPSL